MKKSYFVAVLLSTLVVAACGSSGSSSSTAVQLANNAIAALDNITANWTCTTDTNTTCVCPGGGTVIFSGAFDPNATVKATQTATVNNCIDAASDLSFEGTMTVDEDTGEGTLDFSTFGQCSDFDGTIDVSDSGCGGTATGTCNGQALTCNWTLSGDECICGS